MVLSCAVTSDSVLGRLRHLLALGHRVGRCTSVYYFSTHGCRRSGCCLVVGAFEELACAAACWRALMLKKSDIVVAACWCVEVAGKWRES